MNRSTLDSSRRIVRALGIALLGLMSIWIARELWGPGSCDSRGPGLRGERWVQSDGSVKYFDGKCWSDKPVPPSDMAF